MSRGEVDGPRGCCWSRSTRARVFVDEMRRADDVPGRESPGLDPAKAAAAAAAEESSMELDAGPVVVVAAAGRSGELQSSMTVSRRD